MYGIVYHSKIEVLDQMNLTDRIPTIYSSIGYRELMIGIDIIDLLEGFYDGRDAVSSTDYIEEELKLHSGFRY